MSLKTSIPIDCYFHDNLSMINRKFGSVFKFHKINLTVRDYPKLVTLKYMIIVTACCVVSPTSQLTFIFQQRLILKSKIVTQQ